jgi:transcriptional antiterminator NusG
VPTEKVVEIRRGRKVDAERKFFPGYVLVKMPMTDEAYHLIKNTPKVTGFPRLGRQQAGADAHPEKEAERILQRRWQEGVEHPKPSVSFEIGEQVRVSDGPFASFNGVVEEVDEERARLKVEVSIFGRPTPVDLEYGQVEKGLIRSRCAFAANNLLALARRAERESRPIAWEAMAALAGRQPAPRTAAAGEAGIPGNRAGPDKAERDRENGKESYRLAQASGSGRIGEPVAPDRPGARSARHQHHGILQGVQRPTQEMEKGIADPGRHHLLPGQVLHLRDEAPPVTYFLKKAAKIKSGSKEPGKGATAGKITKAQIREIAEAKMKDLNAYDVEGAPRKMIEGSARAMGLEVVG